MDKNKTVLKIFNSKYHQLDQADIQRTLYSTTGKNLFFFQEPETLMKNDHVRS